MYVAALFRRPGWGRRGKGKLPLPVAMGKCLCTLEGFASSGELIKEEGTAIRTPLPTSPIFKRKNVLAEGFLSLLPGN